MSLSIKEVSDRLKVVSDEISLLEILEINADDIVERFQDKIEDKLEELIEDLADEEYE
jgi:hypothetical protein